MGFFTAILITLYGAISIISLANLLTEENCEKYKTAVLMASVLNTLFILVVVYEIVK
mgnify:CR=1 FL=1